MYKDISLDPGLRRDDEDGHGSKRPNLKALQRRPRQSAEWPIDAAFSRNPKPPA
jgi:hypothetical protein